jgi:hypothetical protein
MFVEPEGPTATTFPRWTTSTPLGIGWPETGMICAPVNARGRSWGSAVEAQMTASNGIEIDFIGVSV